MAARNKIIAIGVVAALGVMAWSTLRNPEGAPAGATSTALPAGGPAPGVTTGSATPGAAPDNSPAASSSAPTAPNASVASSDPIRYLRALDEEQITQKFSEMLDPGDCANPIGANGKLQCNAIGALNLRLQEQLKNPDPDWTPAAEQALRAASDQIVRNAGGRVRIVDARCGRDVCQVLAIGMETDNSQPQGWQLATVVQFRQAAWWDALGFADSSTMVSSGAGGREVYYVTQLTAKPRR